MEDVVELMSNTNFGLSVVDSEPKWVLKRLMETLETELKARAERHIKRDLGPEMVPEIDKSEKIE